MLEPMTVLAEVWPVAADEIGLWLASGDDAWRSHPVLADGDVHAEVEGILWDNGIRDEAVRAIHSTSWRPDGSSVILTYMAVAEPGGFARDRWPEARPVTAELAAEVGKPPSHAAADAPVPRYVDVLLHGLRHLAYLLDRDAKTAAAMGPLWRRHLEPFEPALAGMYSEPHAPAA